MSNRRILFFMTTGSPIGGVETWLERICKWLSDHGFDPLVALVRGQAANQPERFRQFHPDLPVVEVDGRGFDREGRIRAVMRCIRDTRPAAVLPLGVVDANDATIRCKHVGQDVRLVVHAQGNLPPMLADLRTYRDWIDLVVCPGKLTNRFLIEWAGFACHRVRHVPNGADRAVIERIDQNVARPLRLGYVGRFTRRDKRVLDAIKLCECLDELHVPYTLDMVGDGPARPELESELPRDGRAVQFHGAVTHQGVYHSILPNLDVLLLFSSSEAFGIALIEAMMNGVVPITSQYVGYHSEKLVVHGTTGLSYPVGDMRVAAEQVRLLSTNRPLLKELSAAGRRFAERNYTWENCLQQWGTALEMVVDNSPICGTCLPPVERITSGWLDRFGVPASAVDLLRRARRAVIGPATMPGGEEWPLFRKSHPAETLDEIQRTCVQFEMAASETSGESISDNSIRRESTIPLQSTAIADA